MGTLWYEAQLVTLAKAFNEVAICWALGGSSLLYFSGLDVSPRDLDILVAVGDMDRADEMMKSLGAVGLKDPHEGDGKYLTQRFLTYDWHGLEIDLMANPGVNGAKGTYRLPFDQRSDRKALQHEGETLYLSSLKDWAEYYDYLERPQRVEMIQALIEKVGL